MEDTLRTMLELARDEEYDRRIQEKRRIVKSNALSLIELYARALLRKEHMAANLNPAIRSLDV